MKSNKSVAVFCAASEDIDGRYKAEACEVGTMLGSMGATLIYGGARAGLMEATAAAVKAAGGCVVGVVPQVLVERNRVSALLDETVLVRDLSERKDVMVQRSDVLVALPGGVGTLDEIFHTMAAATIGYHRKRVVLYNASGFWDGLLSLLRQMADDAFVRGNLSDFIDVACSIDELKQIILKA